MSCGDSHCPGDCDADGTVSIAELIRGVRIALGSTDEACAAVDLDANGTVTVSELVRAVRAALDGCDQPV
jgi:Ca2+-binding EF-hand superfamily protein